jgi:hypothetical protein
MIHGQQNANIIFLCGLAFMWPSDVSVVPCLNCNINFHLITCLMSQLTLPTCFSINFSRVSAWFIWMLRVLWRHTQTIQIYRLSCGNGFFLWPIGYQLVYLVRIPMAKRWHYKYSITLKWTKFSCASPRPHLPRFMVSVSFFFFIRHDEVRVWFSIFK